MAELNPNTPPTPTPTPPADAPEIYKLEFDKSELEKIAIDKGYPNLEQAIEDKETIYPKFKYFFLSFRQYGQVDAFFFYVKGRYLFCTYKVIRHLYSIV
jgi:hypothetical protein